MSLAITKAIIHSLNPEEQTPLLSKTTCKLNDELEAVVTKSLVEIEESIYSRKGSFIKQEYEDTESVQYMVESYKYGDSDAFIKLSQAIAYSFKEKMDELGNIASGDIIIVEYTLNARMCLGVIKLNHKKQLKHSYISDGGYISITTEDDTYATKTKEAISVDLASHEATIYSRVKLNYINSIFNVAAEHSKNQKLIILAHALQSVAEDEEGDSKIDRFNRRAKIATSIKKCAEFNECIIVADVAMRVFDDERLVAKVEDKMKELEVESEFEIDEKQIKKISTQRIVTAEGIEIYIPSSIIEDNALVEINEDVDGDTVVKIKSASTMIYI